MSGRFRGPIEDGAWPERPVARVVSPGSSPRIRGYAVDEDLAIHTSAAERTYLTLAGELPDEPTRKAFEVTLAFASAAHVGEAPTGAAVAGRLAGGRKVGFIQTAAVVLGEQAQRFEVIAAALPAPNTGPVPDALRPADDEMPERAAALASALRNVGAKFETPWDEWGPMAALADAWRRLGLPRPEHWMTLWMASRLPAVVAEAVLVRPGRFREYPMNTPEFVYEEEP